MSAVAIISLVAPFVTFAIGHFHLLLPAPTPSTPVFPTTLGHGELLRYLAQALANAVNQVPAPVAPVVPVTPVTPPAVDLQALLTQLLSLFEKQLVPQTPTVPPTK